MRCIPRGYFDFVKRISEQTPEKPDYWSACGQCDRNTDIAEDILEHTEKSLYDVTQEELDKLLLSKYSTPDEPVKQLWFTRKDVLRILQEFQEVIQNKEVL